MTSLVVRGLSKSYGGVHALRDVSFSVASGEVVALIGPNGAGKTTCFNALNGQLPPDAGAVELDGKRLTGQAPRDIWRLGVGRTFQITATFGSMTARENVQMALASYQRRLMSPFSTFRKIATAEADSLLERVGMHQQATKPCAELAYGDLKRIELAIALANGPRLLLMDEPTAGMAPEERGALIHLAASLARTDGIAVLFTEHDMDVVFAHADRVLVLYSGELIAAGSPDDIQANPRVQEVYLGAA